MSHKVDTIIKYTTTEYIELLKILHCLSLAEFYDMMDRDADQDPGDYVLGKFKHMSRDIFEWLCELDSSNQRRVFEYAEKKQIIYALRET